MCLVAAFSTINLKVELERSLNLYFLSSFILKHNKTDPLNCFLVMPFKIQEPCSNLSKCWRSLKEVWLPFCIHVSRSKRTLRNERGGLYFLIWWEYRIYLWFINSDSNLKKYVHFFHFRHCLDDKIDSIFNIGFATTEGCIVYFTVINEELLKYWKLCIVSWPLNN